MLVCLGVQVDVLYVLGCPKELEQGHCLDHCPLSAGFKSCRPRENHVKCKQSQPSKGVNSARPKEGQKTNSIAGGEGGSILEEGKPCWLGPLLPGFSAITSFMLVYMKNLDVPLWPQQCVQLLQAVPVGERRSSGSAHSVGSWETRSWDVRRARGLPHMSWSTLVSAAHWPTQGAGRPAHFRLPGQLAHCWPWSRCPKPPWGNLRCPVLWGIWIGAPSHDLWIQKQWFKMAWGAGSHSDKMMGPLILL